MASFEQTIFLGWTVLLWELRSVCCADSGTVGGHRRSSVPLLLQTKKRL